MTTRLIFVRHGYSEANHGHIFAGQTDAPLNKTGFLQANCAAEYLADTHIDCVFSSTLSRAYATGLAIAKKKDLDIFPDAKLCEINGGDWENVPFEKLAEISAKEYDAWINDLYSCKCPGGESVKDFYTRIISCVTDIAEKNPGKNICIATHATPIRVVLCQALGLEPKDIRDVPWPVNASINIIDYKNGKFSIVEKDITKHLDGIMTTLPSNI